MNSKIAILFDSQHGFTKNCAIELQKSLPQSELYNINKYTTYDPNDFDTIIVGAPIYKGALDPFVQKFFKRFKLVLLKKKIALFSSGMNEEEFNIAIQDSVPPEIFYNAFIVYCGGKINYEELSKKEKRILKRRLGITSDTEIKKMDRASSIINWINKKA
jgi:menaquinone-dependent protoporphyrinogen IX oxidase